MSCPAFASGAVRALRENRDAVDVLLLVVDQTTWVLASSVFLAPLAAQTAAVSALLTLLVEDCDGVAALTAVARRAAIGCDVMIAVAAVGAVVSGAMLNPAAAGLFGAAGAIFGVLRGVCAALGAGHAPSTDLLLNGLAVVDEHTDTDTTELRRILSAALDYFERDPELRRLAESSPPTEDTVEEENELSPMLVWRATEAPTGYSGSSDNGVANAYSHAYQDAAEVTYRTQPNADLRPWIAAQAEVDLRFIQAMMTGGYAWLLTSNPTRWQRYQASLQEAARRLDNWRTAALSPPFGMWPRSSVRRVLRSGDLQSPPVVVDDEQVNDEDSGGGGGAVVAVVVGAIAAVAALR